MNKPQIIIADPIEGYVTPVLLKIAEKLGGNTRIEVITDDSYLKEYFSTFREISILIINEQWYEMVDVSRQNIRNVFLLCEEEYRAEKLTKGNVHGIYKYTSIKEIYNEIYYVCAEDLQTHRTSITNTKVITVYSPAGGSGKTTIALGLAANLAVYHRKVLYVDAEYMQAYQWILKENNTLPSDCVTKILKKEADLLDILGEYIRENQFDYFLPFTNTISAYNIDSSFYYSLLNEIKQKNRYDFVVVDTDSVYDSSKKNLMEISDKVLLVTGGDTRYSRLFQTLKRNLNYNDKTKFMIVKNEMKIGKGLLQDSDLSGISYDAQIGYIAEEIENVEQIRRNNEIQKIALMLI